MSQKKLTFVWGAVAPLNFELRIKVRGVLESRGSQLYNAYNSFSVAFKIPEIFEFKVAYPKKNAPLFWETLVSINFGILKSTEKLVYAF